MRSMFARMNAAAGKFSSARSGNVATIFAVTVLPIMASVGAAVDYSHANSARTDMQAALDSTALALIKTAASTTSADLTTNATGFFGSTFSRPEIQGVQVSATYDTSTAILTVSASGTMSTAFTSLIGITQLNVSGLSKATLAGRTWPVCVLITNTTQAHTLFTQDTAKINFDNCMVQVNTTDWDAVESRNTSYIHSTNGENCFVGQIHYGDVQPPKDPSCTFFQDPFAGQTMPASASSCDYTNFKSQSSATLQPGTYCGSTKLSGGGNITLSPGLYIIKDGDFTISGSANVTGNGVTFILTGNGPNFYVTNSAQLTLTPMTSGQFAGFAFYQDTNANLTACASANGDRLANGRSSNGDCINSVDNSAQMNVSGIVYLTNSAFVATNSAVVNVTGSFISNLLVAANSAQISLKGATPNSSAVAAAMQKLSQNGTGALRLLQ